jgi:hypothetical protein
LKLLCVMQVSDSLYRVTQIWSSARHTRSISRNTDAIASPVVPMSNSSGWRSSSRNVPSTTRTRQAASPALLAHSFLPMYIHAESHKRMHAWILFQLNVILHALVSNASVYLFLPRLHPFVSLLLSLSIVQATETNRSLLKLETDMSIWLYTSKLHP